MPRKHSNGAGSVYYERFTRRWVAAVTLGYDAAGRMVRRRAYAKTQREAKARLARLHQLRTEQRRQPEPKVVVAADSCQYHEELVEKLAREVDLLKARLCDVTESEDCVYFLQRASDGLVKIGTSCQREGRLRVLKGEHGAARLLATVPGGRRVEQHMHWLFMADRVRGEWFRLSRCLQEYLNGISQLNLWESAADNGWISTLEAKRLAMGTISCYTRSLIASYANESA